MRVIFRRTGARRYAVVVEMPGEATQTMNPAPGFDENIPHDLVHYVVEAALGLDAGVFGRAARGGGTFYAAETASNSREQARRRRMRSNSRPRPPLPDRPLPTSHRSSKWCYCSMPARPDGIG